MTRTSLAVLLTISVIAFSGSIALADTTSDYESIFGAEAKKVTATRTKTDDTAFAAKLIKSAGQMSDSPAMQILLYKKACQFGSASPAGCDTALEALALLEKAVPDKKDQWRQQKFDIVKLRYDKSYGAARKAAGEPYMEMLEALADVRVSEGKGAEAKTLYNRAIMIARYIKSDRASEILTKSKRANAVVAQQVKLKSLQARLKKDAGDTKVRKELILLYVVGLDNPSEAAKLLNDDLDEVTRTYVPLAAKKLDDLDKAICMELGDWYYKTLSKNASAAGKPVVLQRAQGYYQQFLESHKKKDAQSFRVKTALESIEKELEKLGSPAGLPSLSGGKTLILTLGKGVQMKLVRIPAGKFLMGSNTHYPPERPQHEVTISQAFYMGVTEVTQEQYASITGKNPSKSKNPQNPVEMVSWDDATVFCAALSKKTRRAVRLPTEAQWEYACRAGTKTYFSFGNDAKSLDAYGWSKANSEGKPHPVAQKKPNAFGLYDMYGNVDEWCRDWYDEKFYANAKKIDPENTTKARSRILRGGAWGSSPNHCRSAFRYSHFRAGNDHGFRVVVVAASGRK
ncbi:MAG: formylglycine-generating enzyme family protein [Phycisphaerales bacterium]|jgi:formylglycine-generating enzyme required for sulfatase activity|nr:formylglycine-generating enzyme family protein [Phycisphaerales bacterium]